MTRGRTAPPPIIVAPPRDDDPSQDIDFRYFVANPRAREYERPYLAGEWPEPMPPGTKVLVRRMGAYGRVRAFRPPPVEMN